jgi:hypothetical protein
MKLSYSAAWQETLAMLRAHGSTIAAVAGVFLFLPALLVGYLLPRPEADDIGRLIALMLEYAGQNGHWLLLEGLVNMVGILAILRLVFPRGNPTVGGVIAAAAALLPFYFLANILTTLAIGIGFALLIVPGLYLIGRLATVGPAMVAEERRNPIDAIRRSFELTRGNGWAVAGLVLIVVVAGAVAMGALNSVLGIIFMLIAGEDLGRFLVLMLTSATGAAFATVLALLYAGIYRRLSAGDSTAAAASSAGSGPTGSGPTAD